MDALHCLLILRKDPKDEEDPKDEKDLTGEEDLKDEEEQKDKETQTPLSSLNITQLTFSLPIWTRGNRWNWAGMI